MAAIHGMLRVLLVHEPGLCRQALAQCLAATGWMDVMEASRRDDTGTRFDVVLQWGSDDLRVADPRGVSVYLSRRASLADLLDAVRTASHRLPPPLTQRERDVLALLLAGLSYLAMAAELGVSINTIKSHVKTLYRKLDVPNRPALRIRAAELGLDRSKSESG